MRNMCTEKQQVAAVFEEETSQFLPFTYRRSRTDLKSRRKGEATHCLFRELNPVSTARGPRRHRSVLANPDSLMMYMFAGHLFFFETTKQASQLHCPGCLLSPCCSTTHNAEKITVLISHPGVVTFSMAPPNSYDS